MEYKFMQIFGNCNDLFYLGNHRISGPLDNVITKKATVIEKLITDQYFDYLRRAKYTLVDKGNWASQDEPDVMFDYNDVMIVHNNINSYEFWGNLRIRCDKFLDFYKDIQTSEDKYFVVSLTKLIINQKNNAPLEEFHSIISILSRYNILDKTIFVQFDDGISQFPAVKAKWTCKIKNIESIKELYPKINLITINNGDYNKDLIDNLTTQFLEKFEECIVKE